MKRVVKALNEISQSKWNYWFSFVFDAFIVVILILLAFFNETFFWLGSIYVLVSLVFFTLIEYMVHAKLFHGKITLFTKAHAKYYKNSYGYEAMPFFLATLIIAPFYTLSYLFFSFEYAFLFTVGIFLGYITYGFTHHAMYHLTQKKVTFIL